MSRPMPNHRPYDPWLDLATNWPEVTVSVASLPGDLLGLVRYPAIVLHAGSGTAQRRSTLAHEIVHLEWGVPHHDAASSIELAREEARVERTAARRLIALAELVHAVRYLGATASPTALASALDVDQQMLTARLGALTLAEHAELRHAARDDMAVV